MKKRNKAKKRSRIKRKKKATRSRMLSSYDFSKGVRGKYAKRYARGTNIVVLERDVAKVFPDSKSVNKALRSLSEFVKEQAEESHII